MHVSTNMYLYHRKQTPSIFNGGFSQKFGNVFSGDMIKKWLKRHLSGMILKLLENY